VRNRFYASTGDRLGWQVNPSVEQTSRNGDGKVAELLTRGCRGILQKPYTLAQLSERLKAALRPATEGIKPSR
jgi:DNA-binding response OmpR family regulator